MNSHKIGSKNKKNSTFKYISLFVFGILFTIAASQAFTVVTGIDNAIQYIKTIVLTSNGTSAGTTGVALDGVNSKVGSDRYCDKGMTNCKKFPSLVTTGDINTLATTTLSCNNGEIPKYNGSARSCGTDIDTDTDKYLSSASFNTTNGLLSLVLGGGGANIDIKLTGANIFKTNGTNAYYDGAGNIGIGTTTPTEKVQVSNITQIGSNYTCLSQDVGGSYIRVIGNYDNNILDVACTNPDVRSKKPNIQLNYLGTNPTIINNWKINGGTQINFDYSTDGTSYNSLLSILGSNGRVGIGDTTPSYLLDVNGTGRFINAVYAASFYYNSDLRLKDNLQLIQSPLEKILSLNGYTFNWKDGGSQDIGVIAQEVEKVFPQAVSTKVDGYKAVEYGHLVAPLIEAIKELNQKIKSQQKEIDNLKSQLK